MKFKSKIITYEEATKLEIPNGFIVAGDIHLYNNYPYSDHSNLISSRLNDLYKILKDIGTLSNSLNLPIILNGDIIHSGILDYPVELVLTKFLKKFKSKNIFINLGNHDMDGNVSVLDPLVRFGKASRNHTVIIEPSIIKSNKNTYYCFIPYSSEIKTIFELKKICSKLSDSNMNILFIHNSFSGAIFSNKRRNKSGLNQGSRLLAYFDLVVASHIHKYQEICSGRGFYTSSVMPINFGEREKEHGYHIVDLANNTRYFIIPDVAKFKYVNLSNLLDTNTDKVYKKIRGNIVCVKIDKIGVHIDKNKIKKKLIKNGALFVTFKTTKKSDEIREKININDTTNIESIIISYSKQITEKNNLVRKEVEREGLRILAIAKKYISAEATRR